ncbi:hypothetical protein ACQQ2Q_01665 [Agrobacterium sp. ES01]|uniref:hypothetical protein n=1 Tax=Agrobacterium sp. ES01 TaxID=3420714 RepID=UPI003D0B21D4
MSYELKRTEARAVFKRLLGQANHFLITILIGLQAVRDGTATPDEEFRTSWNPKSAKDSADRSRMFSLDLALVRAVDALDTYMMRTNRKPFAISASAFRSAMDGTGQSVSKRLSVFLAHAGPLPPEHAALLSLGIAWRNRRVHSLSDNDITADERDCLKSKHTELQRDYAGLLINDMLKHFDASEPPHFKEAAAVIRAAQNAVGFFDIELLRQLDLEDYLAGLLSERLGKGPLDQDRNRTHAVRQTWGHPIAKENKVLRVLNMVGVHKAATSQGSAKKPVFARSVPDCLVDRIVSMDQAEALEFIAAD